MLEGLIFGIIQGVTEWLPVSSEGILTIVGLKFFGKDLTSSLSMAVFLHLGTFLAALIYFRKDVMAILKKLKGRVFHFLLIASLVTGVLAVPLLFFVAKYFNTLSTAIISGLVGVLLIFTGLLQFKKNEAVFRMESDLNLKDGIWAGLWQGIAALPGLSRSGLTVACLLLRKFKDSEALRLSFLMSLPAVLGGNILFNMSGLGVELGVSSITALASAFVVGFLTIGVLLRIARKINFGWFALGFGVLTLAGLFF